MGNTVSIGSIIVYSFCSFIMVAFINKNKMSPQDRLNYLYNELEQLEIKQQRYEKDKLRPRDDIAFYIKCNQHFLQRINEEIKLLEEKNGAKQ